MSISLPCPINLLVIAGAFLLGMVSLVLSSPFRRALFPEGSSQMANLLSVMVPAGLLTAYAAFLVFWQWSLAFWPEWQPYYEIFALATALLGWLALALLHWGFGLLRRT